MSDIKLDLSMYPDVVRIFFSSSLTRLQKCAFCIHDTHTCGIYQIFLIFNVAPLLCVFFFFVFLFCFFELELCKYSIFVQSKPLYMSHYEKFTLWNLVIEQSFKKHFSPPDFHSSQKPGNYIYSSIHVNFVEMSLCVSVEN